MSADVRELTLGFRGNSRQFAAICAQMVPTFLARDLRCRMESKLLDADRAHSIIGGFYAVYNYFGYGLAESVYAGGLEYELVDRGHTVVRELAVDVSYKGRHVAWQRLDMVVDNRVILEIKASETLPAFASRQLVNYLRATSFQLGLLLHFGPDAKYQRFVDSQKRRFGVTSTRTE
jgi:GxxExxY protein